MACKQTFFLILYFDYIYIFSYLFLFCIKYTLLIYLVMFFIVLLFLDYTFTYGLSLFSVWTPCDYVIGTKLLLLIAAACGAARSASGQRYQARMFWFSGY